MLNLIAICGLVDFSKALNCIDHNVIVTILSDLNIPTCALRLITSYLSNRRMCVHLNGATSKKQLIPGRGPHGSLLTEPEMLPGISTRHLMCVK